MSQNNPMRSHTAHERIATMTYDSTKVEKYPSGPTGAENASKFKVLANFAVNPALPSSFPWGANVARQYTRFGSKKLHYTVVPNLSDLYSGELYIGWSPDTLQQEPKSAKEFELLTVKNNHPIKDNKPLRIVIPPAHARDDHLFTRSAGLNGVDLKTYDHGRIFIAVEGVVNDFNPTLGSDSGPPLQVVLGYLEALYDFELRLQKPLDLSDGSIVPNGSISAISEVIPPKLCLITDLTTGPMASRSVWPIRAIADLVGFDPLKSANKCNIRSATTDFADAAGDTIPALAATPGVVAASDGIYDVSMKVPVKDPGAAGDNLEYKKVNVSWLESELEAAEGKVKIGTSGAGGVNIVAVQDSNSFTTVGNGAAHVANTDFLGRLKMLAGMVYTPVLDLQTTDKPVNTVNLYTGKTDFDSSLIFEKVAGLALGTLPSVLQAYGGGGAMYADLEPAPITNISYPDNGAPYRRRLVDAVNRTRHHCSSRPITTQEEWDQFMTRPYPGKHSAPRPSSVSSMATEGVLSKAPLDEPPIFGDDEWDHVTR